MQPFREVHWRRVGVVAGIALAVAAAAVWNYRLFGLRVGHRSANSIIVIAPYRYAGTWVFDDPQAALTREAFVGGAPEVIDALVAGIPDAQKGFRLTASASPFPGYSNKLTWLRGDTNGNTYRLDKPEMEAWLCPALFKYYEQPPRELYVRADPLP